MPCPCQLCPATNATVHLTELSAEGLRSELHICRLCIVRLQIELDHPPAIALLLLANQAKPDKPSGTASDEEHHQVDTVAVQAPEQPCPQCGLEFSAYAQNNLFGCSECYESFAAQVSELVLRYHGAVQHAGRLPAGGADLPAQAHRSATRHALHAELAEAIASEQYERAATVRDQLRELDQ